MSKTCNNYDRKFNRKEVRAKTSSKIIKLSLIMEWIRSKFQAFREKVRYNKDPQRWRDLTAYWVLGLCNNYGYVVMLSAAHDIISRLDGPMPVNSTSNRMCQMLSAGAILLADIIPSFIVKALNPFFPFYIK